MESKQSTPLGAELIGRLQNAGYEDSSLFVGDLCSLLSAGCWTCLGKRSEIAVCDDDDNTLMISWREHFASASKGTFETPDGGFEVRFPDGSKKQLPYSEDVLSELLAIINEHLKPIHS